MNLKFDKFKNNDRQIYYYILRTMNNMHIV